MIDKLLLKLDVKKRRAAVMAAPVAVAALLGGLFVVRPNLATFRRVEMERSALKEKGPLFNTILSAEGKLANYENSLAGENDPGKWTESLNTLASESGLNILSIEPGEKLPAMGPVDVTTFRIEAEGNYHQIGEFVSRAEAGKEYIRILRLDINTETPEASLSSLPLQDVQARSRASTGKYRLSISVGFFTAKKDLFS